MPDIAFWNKCDNRCVMCSNMRSFPAQDSGQYSLRGQAAKLERYLSGRAVYAAEDGGRDQLTLTGGEPALHPEFFKLLAYFRRRLPLAHITLLTNGRRFASRAFARRFVKIAREPFTVCVPLHGPGPRLHDKVAGAPGSFAACVAGLRNLFALRGGQELELRVVLHALNLDALGATLRFIRRTFVPLGAFRLAIVHHEPEGAAAENRALTGLRLKRSARELARLKPELAALPGFRLLHFPACVLPGRLRAACVVSLPRSERVYPAATCRGCSLRRGCAGLMAEYYRAYGGGELRKL